MESRDFSVQTIFSDKIDNINVLFTDYCWVPY